MAVGVVVGLVAFVLGLAFCTVNPGAIALAVGGLFLAVFCAILGWWDQ